MSDSILELIASVKGWYLNQAWEKIDDDGYKTACIGVISDGEKYPVATIDCGQYDQEGDSIKVARYIAAANPEYMASLQETIRTQQATIERLTEQLKAMVETYQYEASSENPTLLTTKALIAEIEASK